VSDTVGRSGIVGPSILWGTAFSAGIAFAILVCVLVYDGTRVANGDFRLLLGLGAVPMLMIGGIAGAVLFGLVGVIVRLGPGWLVAASPLSYAVLSCLLWAAGCWLRGLDLLLHEGLLPVAIAGVLTGSMVRSGRNQAYRTSRPGANR
jgi:hypothetical protein